MTTLSKGLMIALPLCLLLALNASFAQEDFWETVPVYMVDPIDEKVSLGVREYVTGYLTIRRTEPRGGRMYYRLGYPNQEVRQSLNETLLNHLTGNPARRAEHSARLYDLLLVNDFDSLKVLLEAFFASIPYQWHTNNKIADYEGYYASVFYSYFTSLGLAITVEDSSQAGRLDMAVEFNENVYLFEFKVVEQVATGAALTQLKARDYAAKYRGRGVAVYLIGVEFSRETRNVAAFAVERA